MRNIFTFFIGMLVSITPVAAEPYLALSFGTSTEAHQFDVWNGPATSGRRALGALARSSDYAVAIGYRNALQLNTRSFDVELEIFERQNSSFIAIGRAGRHPTAIKTTSVLASIWTPIGKGNSWTLRAGVGLGARHSVYRMSGPGIGFKTTDRAPYAMIGLRLSKRAGKRTTLFSEIRAHTRPPIHSSGGQMTGPLEHNSTGITLRMGLQIDLGH